MSTADVGHIDVTGEASYEEQARKFIMNMELTVRSPRKTLATAELEQLKQRCVRRLIEAGIQPGEIADGGADLGTDWHRRTGKNDGKKAEHRLILIADDPRRLRHAVTAVEPLFEPPRCRCETSMRQPVFQCPDDAVTDARRRSVSDARAKAETLATEAGSKLGKVLQILELTPARRRSGAMGDEDYRGDADRLLCSIFSHAAEPIEIDSPTRTVWLRCRVRFALNGG